ncbi:hypothetical protein [Glaciimonas soli]|uniref:Uncharacterized protein n=1 Tax=Glaciimonas soli TaxID=2590999 RepID=A0A843YXL9_9BURK|nr:hypothetical protein [Glaciimonas soli]MQR02414.1 hypothetical protein [Glaciimonas soli]
MRNNLSRYTTLTLALAASFSAWGQGTVNGPVGDLSLPVSTFNGANDQSYKDGIVLPPLDTGNSNLPPVSPHVFADKIQGADYRLNAIVGKISVSVDSDSIPADGQTPAHLSISVFDYKGQPVKDAVVTVETSGGRLQIPGAPTPEFGPGSKDLDHITPGMQVKVVDGKAEILLLAPYQPQDVTVRVTAGKAQAKGVISFIPELREMLAVGLVEGIIHFDGKSPVSLSTASTGDGFDQEIQSFSRSGDNGKLYGGMRTAFFLKGKIKGDALLTMAYDSDKDLQGRLFRDVNPDDYYAVYGDSSIKGFDAQSKSKLYVRIDKDKSYILYGDFQTGDGFSQVTGGGSVASIKKRDLGNYSRSMNGARGHYDANGVLVNAFATKDSLVQLIQEFPGQGLSGPFAVSAQDAQAGSETVEILTRDRNQPAVILSTVPLQRYVDYSFEPFSGHILLTRPLPSVDANGNPESLRVTYEVDSGGPSFWVTGVDAQVKLGQHLEVGGSFVKDKNPYAPYTLSSGNASIQLGPHTTIVAEYARSQSMLGDGTGLGASTNGSPYSLQPTVDQPSPVGGVFQEVTGAAYRVEMLHQDDDLQARAYYGHSDPYFNNPAASLSQGRDEGALKVTKKLDEKWSVYAEGTHSEDEVAQAKRDAESAGVAYKINPLWDVDVGVTHTNEVAGDYGTSTISLGSGLLVNPQSNGFGANTGFGVGSSLLNPQTGYGLNGSSYGLAGITYHSTGLRVRTTYKLTEKVDLTGEYEHGVGDDDYHRASIGAAYHFAEMARLYAKYEWVSGLSSPDATNGLYDSSAFVLGIDNEYMKDQRVFSEYAMRDAIDGDQLTWASGLRNMWNVSDTVKVTTSEEYLRAYHGNTQGAYAVTGGIEWRPSPLWLLSSRLEWRHTKDIEAEEYNASEPTAPPTPTFMPGNDTYLSTISAARKINRDWTFLGKNYLLYTDNRGYVGNLWEDKVQAGIAYRDTDTNRLNVLARYEYWVQRDQSGLNTLPPPETTDDLNGDPNISQGFEKHIISINADYHPSRPWWLDGRAAAKWENDLYSGGHDKYSAYLLSGRVTYDISKRWDIGVLGSVMYSPQGASKQYAFGPEVGYQLQDNLWLSAGWNVRGFNDRDLTGSDYTNQGVYLRIRFKFDEDLFGKRNPDVNPALTR